MSPAGASALASSVAWSTIAAKMSANPSSGSASIFSNVTCSTSENSSLCSRRDRAKTPSSSMVATTPWLMRITDAGRKVTYLDGTYTAMSIRKGTVVTYVGGATCTTRSWREGARRPPGIDAEPGLRHGDSACRYSGRGRASRLGGRVNRRPRRDRQERQPSRPHPCPRSPRRWRG
jgi:hypothetical protein